MRSTVKKTTDPETKLYPGQELIGWLPLGGLLLMGINDHWLRLSYPCWITGKLSDFGVVAFFPFLVTSVIRLGLMVLGVNWRFTKVQLLMGMSVTALGLCVINTISIARDLYISALEAIDIFNLFGQFRYTVDPSDCLALLILPIIWLYGKRKFDLTRNGKEILPQ